mgnify:CR=1 FL=1
MIVGWLRSDASMRAAWGQAVAASEAGKQAADLAAAAYEVVLKNTEVAKERCRVEEAELEIYAMNALPRLVSTRHGRRS